MNLTAARLQAALPKAPAAWLPVIVEECPKWGIETPHEAASFLAQVAHESNELTRLEENLNYSAERLTQVWPRRFPSLEAARAYEHNPERLGNFIYAGRLGNGLVLSGDGYRFRGRGPIQITGRRNYVQCGHDIGEDLAAHPELLREPFPGIRSALWFWRTMNLDELDDDADVRLETRRINGGETGLAMRQRYFDHILEVLTA